MDCDSAPMNPASYALYPESMMASWNMEDRAFHAFVFTVSYVQAPFVQLEALINRLNDDKLMLCL